MAWLGPVLRVSQDCHQGVDWAAFSSEGLTEEESASKLICVVDRIHFLAAL